MLPNFHFRAPIFFLSFIFVSPSPYPSPYLLAVYSSIICLSPLSYAPLSLPPYLLAACWSFVCLSPLFIVFSWSPKMALKIRLKFSFTFRIKTVFFSRKISFREEIMFFINGRIHGVTSYWNGIERFHLAIFSFNIAQALLRICVCCLLIIKVLVIVRSWFTTPLYLYGWVSVWVDRTCPLEEEIKLLNIFIPKISQYLYWLILPSSKCNVSQKK